MLELRDERPSNAAHFVRLLEFAHEIVRLCDDLGVVSVLTGSLAVFGYTRDQTMSVNDIDLACSEHEFSRLSQALRAQGVEYRWKPWHVLQTWRGELKVEFDSLEYWMSGVPQDYETLRVAGLTFTVLGLSGLRELYRRGLEETARQQDSPHQVKHAAIQRMYAALLRLEAG